MMLSSLDLRNFRLHTNTQINFSDSINYLIGGNGQGKTTILEAIYYLCTTKNLNLKSDSDAVTFSEKGFELYGKFNGLVENNIKLVYDGDINKKSYFIDNKQIGRASSIIGKFPVVALTQNDHSITLGSPSDRRKFIDSVIAQSNETYLDILLEYNKTLRQRAALLSEIRERRNTGLYLTLESWTETLVKNGSEIIKHRLAFFEEFKEYIKNAYAKVMSGIEEPRIDYNFYGEKDQSKITDVFYEQLNRIKDEEVIRAQNLIGPHRDDYAFYINGLELKRYGSQGQHKTFQIALRFGQFFYMKEKLSKTPIFLMDDVFGELDTNRADNISRHLREIGQAFITLTDFSNIKNLMRGNGDLTLNIQSGRIANA